MQRPGPPARSATNSTPANSYAIVTRKAMVEFKPAVATEEELRQNRPRWPQCRARHNATGADRALELDDWESVARRSTHDHSLAKRKRHGIPRAGRSVYRPLTGRCGRVCGTRRGGHVGLVDATALDGTGDGGVASAERSACRPMQGPASRWRRCLRRHRNGRAGTSDKWTCSSSQARR